MFKVNNKDTRTTTVNFEQVNFGCGGFYFWKSSKAHKSIYQSCFFFISRFYKNCFQGNFLFRIINKTMNMIMQTRKTIDKMIKQ